MEKTIKYRGQYKDFEILDLSKNTLDEIETILGDTYVREGEAGCWSKKNPKIKIIILPEQIAVDLTREQISNFPNLQEVIWPKANKIADYLFDNSKLKYISIGECETIGIYAFSMCELTEIKLPKNLRTLSVRAFSDCTNLKAVDMSDLLDPINIPDYCFFNNSKLESIDFNKICSIGEKAFGFTGFRSLSLPISVKSICTRAFVRCKKMNTLVFNSNAIEFKGDAQFADCIALKEVNINHNLDCIPDRCFANCTNLNIIKNAETIKRIGINAFSSTGITQINMPVLEEIGNWAFRLSLLDRIVIPNTVTYIGVGAFFECKNLKEVYWSFNCKNAGDYTFYSCTSLNSLKGFNCVEKIGHVCFNGVVSNIEFTNLQYIEDDSFDGFAGKADLRKTAVTCLNDVPTEDNVLLPYYY